MVRESDCDMRGPGFNSHSVMKNFLLKFMLLEKIYLSYISFYSMTFDLDLLRRSLSTVKYADERSMFQLILNN